MEIETIIQHTLGPLGALAISVVVAFKLFQFVERLITEFKQHSERLLTTFEQELDACNKRHELIFMELIKLKEQR